MSVVTYTQERKRIENIKEQQKLLRDIIEQIGILDAKIDILIELKKKNISKRIE